MDVSKNYSTKQFIGDIAKLIVPYKTNFILGVILRFTSDLASLYPAFALSQIVPLLNTIHNVSSIHAILFYLLFWFFSALYDGFFHDYSNYVAHKLAESTGLD